MIVTGLNGVQEMLTDYKELTRKMAVNGEYSLSFFLLKTKSNEHSYSLVENEAFIDLDSQKYRVKKIKENTKGLIPIKRVTCRHIFFDIIDNYQDDVLNGTINIVQALNHVFGPTPWTWINHGAFPVVQVENWGNKNCSALFAELVNKFGAEFIPDSSNMTVTIKNEIGNDIDAQFRFNHNIKTLSKNIDTTNLSTFIKGYGKKDGNGAAVYAEYTSTLASKPGIGIRVQDTVYDERFTSTETLTEHLKSIINDDIEMILVIKVIELRKNGVKLHNYNLGDKLYTIYEPLEIDTQLRILEIIDYPGTNKSPSVVLSNVPLYRRQKTITDITANFSQTQKQVKDLTDADGNISLSLALKKLYRNSYVFSDESGDWYMSDDPNAYVHIGSGGIDVHKGLIRVERDDGFPIIIGGKLQVAIDIQGADPEFRSGTVGIYGYWWGTQETTRQNCQYYTYEHKARYLKLKVAQYVEEGATCYLSVVDPSLGEENQIIATVSSTNTDPFGEEAYSIITVDLGVPTGELKDFYIHLHSSDPEKLVYARVLRKWLEG